MTKLRITVTKEILERSKYCASDINQGYNCAVALAVKDIFPEAYCYQSFMVFDQAGKDKCDSGFFSASKFKGAIGAHFPAFVFMWIQQFDRIEPNERVKMSPISFEISIPDEVIEKINIDELKPLLENHPTLELIES